MPHIFLHAEDIVITPILKTSKLRPREIKKLPNHTASKCRDSAQTLGLFQSSGGA